MKAIILGNAGSGKSTLAKQLIMQKSAALLPLDDVAFAGGVQRRPLEASVADVKQFIAEHDRWIIEGCYADIIESVLQHCELLIFLNPGVEACVEHCRARPWEPEKFNSKEEQDAHLENLIQWVQSYNTRVDEYGLARHLAIYEACVGNKIKLTNTSNYQSVIALI